MAQWSVAKKTRVLVVCSGNSAPSQITEALIRHEAGDVFKIVSAGIHSVQVRVEAVAVMLEIGLDISSQRSKPLTDLEGQKFDFVITVCNKAREECPTFSIEPKRLHWPFEDPATFTEKQGAPTCIPHSAGQNSCPRDGVPRRRGVWLPGGPRSYVG